MEAADQVALVADQVALVAGRAVVIPATGQAALVQVPSRLIVQLTAGQRAIGRVVNNPVIGLVQEPLAKLRSRADR